MTSARGLTARDHMCSPVEGHVFPQNHGKPSVTWISTWLCVYKSRYVYEVSSPTSDVYYRVPEVKGKGGIKTAPTGDRFDQQPPLWKHLL